MKTAILLFATVSGVDTLADPYNGLWAVFDPTSDAALLPTSFDFGSAVAGSSFDNIVAIGYYFDGESLAGTTSYAAHQLNSLQFNAVAIPEPAAIAAILGMVTFGLLQLRRRHRIRRCWQG